MAFTAYCCECGTELSGIRPHRIRKNPNRRCVSCFRKSVKGWHLSQGYIRKSGRGKREYEHRIVAAQILGRPLAPGEVVHHRSEVRTENDPENLYVYSSPGKHALGAGHVIQGPDGKFCSPSADEFRKKK